MEPLEKKMSSFLDIFQIRGFFYSRELSTIHHHSVKTSRLCAWGPEGWNIRLHMGKNYQISKKAKGPKNLRKCAKTLFT